MLSKLRILRKTELLFGCLIIAFSSIIYTKHVSVDVQKVYLSKTVGQEAKLKSTCNMKYVRYIKKLENTA